MNSYTSYPRDQEKWHNRYESWRRAVRRAYPDIKFHGNKDKAYAVIESSLGRQIIYGEWDGSRGMLFMHSPYHTEFNNPALPAGILYGALSLLALRILARR